MKVFSAIMLTLLVLALIGLGTALSLFAVSGMVVVVIFFGSLLIVNDLFASKE